MDKDNQVTVFEHEDDNENSNGGASEQTRPRALLVVGAIAAIMLGILIVALVMTKPSADKELENIVRAGSQEFDAYKNKVAVEIDPESKIVYPNMIGMWQLQAKAKLSNKGDRELLGVEVVGKMIDHQDHVIAQTVTLPVPRVRKEPLKPGESMTIAVKVDAPSKVTEAEVKDITIELRGLRFQ
ncbi:MAG: hypothetical protein J2P21_16460 [Chloracidobacterium sp.]|nr:hypothetical protein [Chloracidobacterium sp.]